MLRLWPADSPGEVNEPVVEVPVVRLRSYTFGQAEKHRQAAMENTEKLKQQTTGQEHEPGETDLPRFYYSLGIHFLGERDWERAINAFTSVIELEPDNASAYDRRGIACGRAERYGEAITDFNRAIELEPNYVGAYNNRGLSYYRQGRISEAIADYDTAIQLGRGIAAVQD